MTVVHLELHTRDLNAASAFYSELLEWHIERIDSRWGAYHALRLGGALEGGIVECAAARAAWSSGSGPQPARPPA